MLGLDKSFVTGGDLGLAPFPSVAGGAGNPSDLPGNTASYVSIASAASPAQKSAAEAFMQTVLASASYAKATVGAGEVPVIKGATDLFAGQQLSSYDQTIYSSVQQAPSFPPPRWTASLPVPSRTAPAVTPRRVSHRPSHSRGLADLAGLAPAMALFGVFIAVPMLGAVALSLFRWNGLGTPHWAGGANWVQFAHDPRASSATVRCTQRCTCCRCCCPRRASR